MSLFHCGSTTIITTQTAGTGDILLHGHTHSVCIVSSMQGACVRIPCKSPDCPLDSGKPHLGTGCWFDDEWAYA